MGVFDVFSYAGDKKQYDAYQGKYKQGKRLFQRELGKLDVAGQQGEGLLRGNLGVLRQGYGQAASLLGRSGGAARTNILSNQNQGLSNLQKSLSARGLGSTSVLENAQRGVYSDTSRKLAEVDEALGGEMANLAVGRTGAIANARSGLAGFLQNRAQTSFDARNTYINYLLDRMGTKPQFGSYLASSANSGADLAAFAATGGFGG